MTLKLTRRLFALPKNEMIWSRKSLMSLLGVLISIAHNKHRFQFIKLAVSKYEIVHGVWCDYIWSTVFLVPLSTTTIHGPLILIKLKCNPSMDIIKRGMKLLIHSTYWVCCSIKYPSETHLISNVAGVGWGGGGDWVCGGWGGLHVIPSYQFRHSHYKDKMVLLPSCL